MQILGFMQGLIQDFQAVQEGAGSEGVDVRFKLFFPGAGNHPKSKEGIETFRGDPNFDELLRTAHSKVVSKSELSGVFIGVLAPKETTQHVLNAINGITWTNGGMEVVSFTCFA